MWQKKMIESDKEEENRKKYVVILDKTKVNNLFYNNRRAGCQY